MNVSRSFQSGQSSSRCGGLEAAHLAGELLVQAEAVVLRSSISRSCSPKITSSGVRAEWMSRTSFISSWWSRQRSMDMIGVIPLPALMNSSFSGIASGSTNSPSTPPSETIVPGRPRRTR